MNYRKDRRDAYTKSDSDAYGNANYNSYSDTQSQTYSNTEGSTDAAAPPDSALIEVVIANSVIGPQTYGRQISD